MLNKMLYLYYYNLIHKIFVNILISILTYIYHYLKYKIITLYKFYLQLYEIIKHYNNSIIWLITVMQLH